MKYLDWNAEKNEILKKEREISFEDIAVAVQEGKLIKVIDHPNQKKYPEQKIMIVDINNYAYLVPFIEDKYKIFLKTIYPSREATKLFIINKL